MSVLLYECFISGAKPIKWRKASTGVIFDNGTFEAPKPETPYKLGVGLHEIMHWKLGHHRRIPQWLKEYEAETATINALKEYGIPFRHYEFQAKIYVLYRILQQWNRGSKLTKIPPEVLRWAGFKKSWKKFKKIKIFWDFDSKKKKEVEIIFLEENES